MTISHAMDAYSVDLIIVMALDCGQSSRACIAFQSNAISKRAQQQRFG